MASRDLSAPERGGDIGHLLELAREADVRVRDAGIRPARGAQCRRRAREVIGAPVVGVVVLDNLFQPSRLERVELTPTSCEVLQRSEYLFA